MECGGLPPLSYAPGLPGRGASRRFFLRVLAPRVRDSMGRRNRAGQAPPYESESKLSHSKFPFRSIPLSGL
jgi:hypothetical protein